MEIHKWSGWKRIHNKGNVGVYSNGNNYNGYSGVVWNMVCIGILRGR